MVKLLQNHHRLKAITPRKRSSFPYPSSLHPLGDSYRNDHDNGNGDRDQGHRDRADEKGNRRIVTRTHRGHGGPDHDHEDHDKIPNEGHAAAASAEGDRSSLERRTMTGRDVVRPAETTVRAEEVDGHAMARKRRLRRPSDDDKEDKEDDDDSSARPPSKQRLRLSFSAAAEWLREEEVPSAWGAVRDVRAAVSLMTKAVQFAKEAEGMGRRKENRNGNREDDERDSWRQEILRGLADLQKETKSMTALVSDRKAADETNRADSLLRVRDDGTIGGIPKRFLDLTHFPRLRSSSRFPADALTPPPTSSPSPSPHEGKWKCFPGENHHGKDTGTSHIIDCTEGNCTVLPARGGHRDPALPLPDRIPTACHSHPHDLRREDTAMGANDHTKDSADPRKEIKSRIHLSHASLSHVNGTYIQEGTYNRAPLFVRVGPPRKFMGKWDCAVVLRRERALEEEEETTSSGEGVDDERKCSRGKDYVWKIGLVPSRRITHPRIIGYYYTGEDNAAASKTGMPMTETTTLIGDEEDEKEYYEPPTLGWRVYHNKKEGYSSGRASGLRIYYEE
mmetsp:Transcript_28874/g.54604  ORF Transcript_28874/g.54604 Transcript_28874/m.54604 type:complete len:563 (+) Transcript_28874:34-1722(+)